MFDSRKQLRWKDHFEAAILFQKLDSPSNIRNIVAPSVDRNHAVAIARMDVGEVWQSLKSLDETRDVVEVRPGPKWSGFYIYGQKKEAMAYWQTYDHRLNLPPTTGLSATKSISPFSFE